MTDPSPAPFDPDATQPVPVCAQPVNAVSALAAGDPTALNDARSGTASGGESGRPPGVWAASIAQGNQPSLARLAYSTPRSVGRPGILTALGVMSIIVAALSGMSSLSTGFQAVVFGVMLPRMSALRTTTTTTTTTTVTTTTAGGSLSGGTTVPLSPITPGTPAPATAPATAPSTTTVTPAGPVVPLTATQVQTIVQAVQTRLNNTMNPAQVTTLAGALRGTSPQLVSPLYAYSPVQSATRDSAGGVDINFTGGGGITIDSSGAITSQAAPPPGGAPFPFPKLGVGVVVLVAADAVASLILAVALVIAGILVFRNSAKARWLHRRYAWLKLPVAVAGAAGAGIMYGRFVGGFAGGNTGMVLYMGLFYFVLYLALGCAYPIAVLIVLRTKSVRGYYHSVAVG